MVKPSGVPVLLLVALALLVGACTGSSDSADNPGAGDVDVGLSGAIVISAAASLTEALTQIQSDFESANPDTKLEINFGSSGQLSTQIQAGAPVDVAAFADTTLMDALVKADLLDGDAQIFANNKLVIITKPGNPENIRNLNDLADAGVVALCNDAAPCGKFADQVLSDAGVSIDASTVTRGQDVKATLGAVTEGDAVAGIVYETDAADSKGADTVEIPDDLNVVAEYPIAVVADGANPTLAEAFVEYVLGPKGQAVLREFGFLPA